MYKRSAIALMITVFFMMAISVVLAISLKHLNEATYEIKNENFTLQSSVILDDVLNILKASADLDAIVKDNSKESLLIFLSQASFIPLEMHGVNIVIELSSARSKLNINSLVDANSTMNLDRAKALEQYLSYYDVRGDYIDILLDNMSKVKEDMSYNSAIFNENSQLFRDYISSKEHFEAINDFYTKSYNVNSLSKIDFKKLFYFSNNRAYAIDVNYATAEVWRLLTACDEQKAEELSLSGGSYANLEDLGLSEEESLSLGAFNVSYYEPILDVSVDISKGSSNAKIRFEYDMSTKKGSNFVYDI